MKSIINTSIVKIISFALSMLIYVDKKSKTESNKLMNFPSYVKTMIMSINSYVSYQTPPKRHYRIL